MGCEEVLLNHCQGQEHGQQGASNEGHVPGGGEGRGGEGRGGEGRGGEGRGGEGRGGEGRGGECLPSRKIVLIITRSFTEGGSLCYGSG